PQDAVTFQKARNPITDFGLARMVERTLKRLAHAETLGGAKLEYVGVEPAGKSNRPAHRFSMHFPPADPFPNKDMDFYVDVETGLPSGVYMRLPNGKLDAMYLYEDVDTKVALSDADFEINSPLTASRAPAALPTPSE